MALALAIALASVAPACAILALQTLSAALAPERRR